jgi:hypothetical protein
MQLAANDASQLLPLFLRRLRRILRRHPLCLQHRGNFLPFFERRVERRLGRHLCELDLPFGHITAMAVEAVSLEKRRRGRRKIRLGSSHGRAAQSNDERKQQL